MDSPVRAVVPILPVSPGLLHLDQIPAQRLFAQSLRSSSNTGEEMVAGALLSPADQPMVQAACCCCCWCQGLPRSPCNRGEVIERIFMVGLQRQGCQIGFFGCRKLTQLQQGIAAVVVGVASPLPRKLR